MRWLFMRFGDPSVGEAIQLPCPVGDLVRVVTAVNDQNPAKEFRRLLRLNPALLLFSLNEFYLENSVAPSSVAGLTEWAQSRLVSSLSQAACSSDIGSSCMVGSKKLKATLAQFLRCRSNAKLTRSLARFLTSVCGVEKKSSMRYVRSILGTQLRADKFQVKRVRSNAILIRLSEQWNDAPDGAFDLQCLLELAEGHLESNAEFALRLNEEKLASMKQLAYGASHEINNPLANVATRAQTLLAIETDPEKRYKLSVIYEQAIRAHEMISDMMLFAHPPALQMQRISIRLLMARIFRELKPQFEAAPHVKTKFVIGAGVDHVDVDPTQFAVAIKSLVENSLESLSQHTNLNLRADHHIELRVAGLKSGALQVTVQDSGEPVSADVARHMFDPFFSGREAGRGLGFGLSKAWTIAKLHGGSLRYESQSESGICFSLTVPQDGAKLSGEPMSELAICNVKATLEAEAA